MTAFVARCLLY